MKYAILLTLLGLAQIGLAHVAGVFSWLLYWSGLSWVLAGWAYGGLGPRVFGKRADGGMRWANVCLLLPYLAVTWFLWYLQRLMTSEPPHNEILPNLWLGRRCSSSELPPGIGLIVDLTAEFSEPNDLRVGLSYICVPTLDAAVPSLKAFQELVQAIATTREPVYVHCALGHGRSATVVVAVLLAKGNASSIDQAEQMVRQARKGIEINAVQRRLLQEWSKEWGSATDKLRAFPSSSIHQAAEQGNILGVKRWLEADPTLLESRDRDGMTPLHKAAATFQDHAEMVEFLLSCGADPNAKDKDNWTPYDWADFYMNRDVIVLLNEASNS